MREDGSTGCPSYRGQEGVTLLITGVEQADGRTWITRNRLPVAVNIYENSLDSLSLVGGFREGLNSFVFF